MTIKYKTNQLHGDETDPPVTERGHRSKDDRLGSDSTRKRALAEAFVALGLDDAARELDRDRAEHWIQQRARTS